MTSPRLTFFVAALVVLIASCGGETSGVSAGSSGDFQLIVQPGIDLTKSDVEVTCRSGPSFPASALGDIPLIEESGLSGVVEAIETFLASGEGDFWPQADWRVLHSTQDQVQLVHLADPAPADGSVSHMTVTGSDGNWKWAGASGASPCPIKTTLPEGLGTVEWKLNDSPDPTASFFTVEANERGCVSGQEMGDRLVGPEVVLTDDAVLLAFAATPPPGNQDQTCPGNPSVTITVELDQPLGDREILDGLDAGVHLADFIQKG